METQVYTVKDIQQLLDISRTTAYNLIKNGAPFMVVKIGDTYRIPKESFDRWLSQN